jgi:hypothetical protein
MAEKQLVCPFCNVPLEPGYVLDRVAARSGRAAEWISGVPEPSWMWGVRTGGRKRREIESWRCKQCGLLQEYAR